MSDGARHLTTDEDRARFTRATIYGGLCTGCGRTLSDDEAVYIEPIAVDRKPLTGLGTGWSTKTVKRVAPLGWECASPAFLAQMAGREPEVCEGCARPLYYAVQRESRQRSSCSRRCLSRARVRAKRGEN